MIDKKKAYFNDVKDLIKKKLDIIEMRMTNENEISEFDIELLEMAIDKLREYNEYAASKNFAESFVGVDNILPR